MELISLRHRSKNVSLPDSTARVPKIGTLHLPQCDLSKNAESVPSAKLVISKGYLNEKGSAGGRDPHARGVVTHDDSWP